MDRTLEPVNEFIQTGVNRGMRGSDVNLLVTAINTALDWRNTAAAADISLKEIIAEFPDGSRMHLVWDETDGQYMVTL